nr:ATP-binding protein [Paraburkholderia sacchari]
MDLCRSGWSFAFRHLSRLYVACMTAQMHPVIAALDASVPQEAALRAWCEEELKRTAPRFAERQARFCLCHGVSGSGKSLASQALAEWLGAIRLSSDAERKRLAGIADAARLPASAYTAGQTDAIYDTLRAHAQTVLESGYTAIVDATFLRERNRTAFIALARRLDVRVVILDFTADRATLFARVAARAALGRGAFDADTAVLTLQLARAEPPKRCRARAGDSIRHRRRALCLRRRGILEAAAGNDRKQSS